MNAIFFEVAFWGLTLYDFLFGSPSWSLWIYVKSRVLILGFWNDLSKVSNGPSLWIEPSNRFWAVIFSSPEWILSSGPYEICTFSFSTLLSLLECPVVSLSLSSLTSWMFSGILNFISLSRSYSLSIALMALGMVYFMDCFLFCKEELLGSSLLLDATVFSIN